MAIDPRPLDPDSQARLDGMLTKHWSLPGEHALTHLHGRALGTCRIFVLLGAKNNVGSHYFQLYLVNAQGCLADAPVAFGLFNRGPYPAFNWIEFTQYKTTLRFAEEPFDLRAEDLELPLFEAISELVPPGGHFMIEYDSADQFATARVLTLGYPPACSPTGYILFRVGCRSYRDWYISEGGREGPRKLQGFKPWNEEIAAEKTALLRAGLEVMLSAPEVETHGEWGALARRLGADVLSRLPQQGVGA